MSRKFRVIEKTPTLKRKNSFPQVQKTGDNQSISSPADHIFFLQRTIGNHAVQKLIRSGTLQTRLKMGKPGDRFEQQADRIAEAVMKMPEPAMSKEQIQRACPGCKEEEEEELMTKRDRTQTIYDLESGIHALRNGGHHLSMSERAFFEPRFGHDFSHVRIHTGSQAAESARALSARAYTIGSDVVFGAGEYSPDSLTGKKLLAHELTHVIQQRKTSGSSINRLQVNKLMVQMSIADAFNNYLGTCDCGEDLGNNCAHYLSDALIRAGYNDLDGGNGARYRRRNGRIVCKAGRPVRARELRDWFAGMATATSAGEPDDNQYWAVYQHDSYPGGHVVIHNHSGTNYTWRGTGDYPAWGTQNHYTW